MLTGQRSRSEKNRKRPPVKPLILFVGGIFVEQRDVLVRDCSCLFNVGDIGPLCQLDSPLNLACPDFYCCCPTHVYLSVLLRLFGWMLRQHPWMVTTVVIATGQPDHLITQGTPRRCPRIGVTLSPSFHCFGVVFMSPIIHILSA